VDARFFYRTTPGTGWLSGMELGINGVNLFNRAPPFVDDQYGYDEYNVQPLGRIVSVDIGKRW